MIKVSHYSSHAEPIHFPTNYGFKSYIQLHHIVHREQGPAGVISMAEG